MTKKKAIEAAQEWAWAQDDGDGLDHNTVARLTAEHAFDLGRVAGMREAARRAIPHAYYPNRAILQTANALARKLRDGRKQ